MNYDSRNLDKEDIEPQHKFDVESNVLWVDTIYWTFHSDLKKMHVKHRLVSKSVKFSYFPDRFCLEMKKISPDKFLIELVRDAWDQERKSGYYFQVSFSVVASPCARKVTYMDYDIDNAPVYFTLDDLLSVYGVNDEWMIKCVIWVRELSPLDNDRRGEQERLWWTKLKEISPEYNQYEQMAFLMGRESFEDLFTGRQDHKFADHKSTLLLRSFRYSGRLVSKMSKRQKELEWQESAEELGRLLGYIKNEQERCIDNKDCILLYASAFYCGLSYLKQECSDYIKMNLNDVDSLIDVMTISDMVNDKDLMDYASSWFLKNKRKVLRSVQWNNFKNRNYELARGFLFTVLKSEFNNGKEEVEHVSSFMRLK